MTLDDARGVLGVADAASPDEVRGAYTRLVKQHKPDRDPEGFRRVREAYEQIREAATIGEMLASMRAAALEASGDAPCAEARVVDAAAPGPLAASTDDDAPQKARAALLERLEDLVRSRPYLVPNVLREHVTQHPRDDATRLDLVELLATAAQFVPAIELLREGARSGRDRHRFLAELALWKPSVLDAAEVESLRGDIRFAPLAAVALVARGSIDEARRHALATLTADAANEVARREVWLQVIAGMFERGATALACETFAQLERAMPGDALAHGDAAATLLVRELVDVADAIDPEVVKRLGMYLCTPVRGAAVLDADPLLVFQRWESIDVMRSRAPQLMRLAFLDPSPTTSRGLSRWRIVLALAVCVGLGVLFVVTLVRDVREHPELYPAVRSEATEALCLQHYGGYEGCDLSRTIDYHLERGQCHEAGLAAMALIAWTHRAGAGASQMQAQRERVLARCPELR